MSLRSINVIEGKIEDLLRRFRDPHHEAFLKSTASKT